MFLPLSGSILLPDSGKRGFEELIDLCGSKVPIFSYHPKRDHIRIFSIISDLLFDTYTIVSEHPKSRFEFRANCKRFCVWKTSFPCHKGSSHRRFFLPYFKRANQLCQSIWHSKKKKGELQGLNLRPIRLSAIFVGRLALSHDSPSYTYTFEFLAKCKRFCVFKNSIPISRRFLTLSFFPSVLQKRYLTLRKRLTQWKKEGELQIWTYDT